MRQCNEDLMEACGTADKNMIKSCLGRGKLDSNLNHLPTNLSSLALDLVQELSNLSLYCSSYFSCLGGGAWLGYVMPGDAAGNTPLRLLVIQSVDHKAPSLIFARRVNTPVPDNPRSQWHFHEAFVSLMPSNASNLAFPTPLPLIFRFGVLRALL